jgi:hypothetical protein
MVGKALVAMLAAVALCSLAGCGSGDRASSTSASNATSTPTKTVHKDPWSCPRAPSSLKPSSLKGSTGPRSAAGRPLAPELLGITPEDACSALASRHLPVQFAPLDYPCPHRPPDGGVAWQQPTAGAALHHGTVLVGTSIQNTCGSERAQQRCQRSQVSLKADGAESGYAGGSGQVSLEAVITNTGSSACEVDGTVDLTLRDQGGHFLRHIWGNPSTIHVHHALEPIEPHGEPLTIEWIWIGWCDPERHVRLSADTAGLHSTDGVPTPTCAGDATSYMQGANVNLGPLP